MFLPLLILATLAYVAFAVVSTVREKGEGDPERLDELHPAVKFVIAGLVPTIVVVTMTYLFLIVGGATTVQFNAGSTSRMNVWSTWVSIWPIFLVITAVNSFGSFVWLIVCACKKTWRPLVVASIVSLLFSVLAFFTVATYFPSA